MRFMATGLSRAHYLGAFEAGFLGFVTYFPSDDIGWASHHDNWKEIAAMSADRSIEFVPTVSPGFNNSAVDRWRFHTIRSRQCSGYYDARWAAAVAEGTSVVMIHSFNSWSEGTAIEPAADRENYSLTDDIWCGKDPNFFVNKTAEWIKRYKRR
jgi:glycoprotein endo-alpha-1,2-mannosidase